MLEDRSKPPIPSHREARMTEDPAIRVDRLLEVAKANTVSSFDRIAAIDDLSYFVDTPFSSRICEDMEKLALNLEAPEDVRECLTETLNQMSFFRNRTVQIDFLLGVARGTHEILDQLDEVQLEMYRAFAVGLLRDHPNTPPDRRVEVKTVVSQFSIEEKYDPETQFLRAIFAGRRPDRDREQLN